MPRLARLFLCVLAVLAAAPAMGKPRRAASERAYQDALRRAQQHYAAREYDLAIAEWEAAHRIRPVPVLLFAIAQAQEVAGRPEQALAAYQDFVDEARPGAQRTQAETRIAALEVQLQHIGALRAALKEARTGPARLAPLFDAGAGLLLGGRLFGFSEQPPPSAVRCYDAGGPLPTCPRFHSSAVAGLRVDATAWPLMRVALPRLRGWGRAAVRGLGLGATVDVFFWPASTLQGAGHPAALPTRELRAEAGLRWVLTVVPRLGIQVRGMVQYGLHQFTLGKDAVAAPTPMDPGRTVPDDHGLPDVRYQYLDLAAGARLPYYGTPRFFIGTVLDFHYHVMLAYGELASAFVDAGGRDGGYGPVERGYGLRIDWVPVEAQPFRGLTLRAALYYERFGMDFTLGDAGAGHPLPPMGRMGAGAAPYYAQGAADQYFGGMLQAAYRY